MFNVVIANARKQGPNNSRLLHLPIMEASGFTPNRSAACLVMSTRAAAPSFSVLALAAVTVPGK